MNICFQFQAHCCLMWMLLLHSITNLKSEICALYVQCHMTDGSEPLRWGQSTVFIFAA